MSSSIYNQINHVNISNMRFWDVIEFSLNLAKDNEDKNINNRFIENFKAVFNRELDPTPDINIDEPFSEEELNYWSKIFFDLAEKIYDRKIGNQDNQEWQPAYIYIAYSFGRLFSESARMKSTK